MPQECLVCNENHKFEDCKTLQNTEFLRSHFIRWCAFKKREAATHCSLQQMNPNLAGTPMNPVLSRTLDLNPHDSEHPEELEGVSDETDFQSGRH